MAHEFVVSNAGSVMCLVVPALRTLVLGEVFVGVAVIANVEVGQEPADFNERDFLAAGAL